MKDKLISWQLIAVMIAVILASLILGGNVGYLFMPAKEKVVTKIVEVKETCPVCSVCKCPTISCKSVKEIVREDKTILYEICPKSFNEARTLQQEATNALNETLHRQRVPKDGQIRVGGGLH